MKSLLIGDGAREHAIAKRMVEGSELYAFVSLPNPGISSLASEIKVGNILDANEVILFARHVSPEYIFIGPGTVIAAGVGDALSEAGFQVVAPSRAGARLEWDPAFFRFFIQDHAPDASLKFAACESRHEVNNAFRDIGTSLSIITSESPENHFENPYLAREYAYRSIGAKSSGSSSVVLQEKAEGEDFTLQVFTDGETVSAMPLVKKYALSENEKTNLSEGVGTYSESNHLLPYISAEDAEKSLSILRKLLRALKSAHNSVYRGVLCARFVITLGGPKLLNISAGFGDPEALNVLSLLKTDFSHLCMSILGGKLWPSIEFKKKASVCKYLVPLGYPEKPKIGVPLSVDEDKISRAGAELYYNSVSIKDGKLYTSEGRSLALLSVADAHEDAEDFVESAISAVNSENLFYRKDIGTVGLSQKGVNRMEELRNA
ncbi:TPA: hypothetical protein H1011_01990 [archaeon]|jgi:phosphoribosylamine--glycine ligase|uniref:phosphoribosylamine--glycine ligase n=1 Tax=Candidatus Undinarchaeum marinum TaxID=2756141 RepID=A0A832XFW7_9ARCH|nr:hypothetical protein [Candidatus Undinarchaeum marinum]